MTEDLRKVPRDKRPAPTTGQSGNPIDLPWVQLNKDERKVVEHLDGGGNGSRNILNIKEIGKKASLEPLCVRNAMRRLVRGDWVENVERGTYRVTQGGRARFAKADKKAPLECRTRAGVKTETPVKATKVAKVKTKATKNGDGKTATKGVNPGFETRARRLLGSSTSEEGVKIGAVIVAISELGFSDDKVCKAVMASRDLVRAAKRNLRKASFPQDQLIPRFAEACFIAAGGKPPTTSSKGSSEVEA